MNSSRVRDSAVGVKPPISAQNPGKLVPIQAKRPFGTGNTVTVVSPTGGSHTVGSDSCMRRGQAFDPETCGHVG